jgi:hypothetical protein
MRLWGIGLDGQNAAPTVQRITKEYPHEFLASLKRTFESGECKPFVLRQIFINGKATNNPITLEDRMLFTLHIAEALRTDEAYDVVRDVLIRLLQRVESGVPDKDSFFRLIQELDKVGFDYGVEKGSLLNIAKGAFMRGFNHLNDFTLFIDFSQTFEGITTEEEERQVGFNFGSFLEKDLEVSSDPYTTSEDVLSYAESLKMIANRFGHDVDDHVIRLEEMADEMRIKEEKEERDEYYAELAKEHYKFSRATKGGEVFTGQGESIDSMFENLLGTPPTNE